MALGKLGKRGGVGSLGSRGKAGSGGSSSPAVSFGQRVVLESVDYYGHSGLGLTGAVDNRFGSLSFWMRPGIQEGGSTTTNANNSISMEIFRSTGGRFRLFRDTSNRVSLTMSNGVSTFTFATTSTAVASDDEAHYAFAWDTSQAAGSKVGVIYKNGVAETVTVVADAGVAFNADFTEGDWFVGATNLGGNLLKGVLREFMLWTGTFIDWSNPANIAKVFGGTGVAVDPGPTGSLVTGTAPVVYLSVRAGEPATAFLTNRGTGGNFAVVGGAAVKRERGYFAWGDSFRNGTAASQIPGKDALYLTTRAFSSPYAWRPRAFPGLGFASIESGFFSRIDSDLVGFEGLMGFEGGINDAGGHPNLASELNASFLRMVNYAQSKVPGLRYMVIGMAKGDPTTMAAGMTVGDRIAAADALNAATFGPNFFDLNQYLITNRVAVAAASSYTLTANDEADAAIDVVPRGFRSAPDANGTATHLNDIGMKGWQMGETAAWAAIGVT